MTAHLRAATTTNPARLLVLVAALCPTAYGQPSTTDPATPPPASSTDVTPESVQQSLDAIANSELADADKEQATKYLQTALEHLKAAKAAAIQSQLHEKERLSAPKRVEDLKRERDVLARPGGSEGLSGTAVEIEQRLGELRAQLSEGEKEATRWSGESARRENRKLEIEKKLTELRDELAKIETDLAAPPANEVPEVFKAFRTSRTARRQAALAEREMIEREAARYQTTSERMRLEAEVAPLRVAALKKRITAGEEALERQRAVERAIREREAERAVDKVHPAVTELAEQNRELATRLKKRGNELSALLKVTEEEVQSTVVREQEITKRRGELEEKLEIPGMAAALGPDLVRERLELPHVGDLRHAIRRRNALIREVRQRTGKDDRERARLEHDHDKLVDAYVAGTNVTRDEVETVEEEVRDLYTTRLNDLRTLHDLYTKYLVALTRLNEAEQTLVATANDFEKYLAGRSRWVRSVDPLSWGDVQRTATALAWLVDAASWRRVATDLRDSMAATPFLTILVFLAVMLLAALRERLRRQLGALGHLASRSYTAPYHLTLQALTCTVAVAAVWPLLVVFVGWQLWASVDAASFSRAVGVGLVTTGVVFATLEFTRQLFRRFGLADAHFHWRRERTRRARTHLRWLAVLGLPSMFIVGLVEWDRDVDRWTTLGRIGLMTQLLLGAAFAHFVFRPFGTGKEGTSTPPGRWERMLHVAATGIPLAFALLTAAGYQYTTWRLGLQLLRTVWLVLAVAVGQGMLVRWLYYGRARLALEQARQRKGESTDGTPTATTTGAVSRRDAAPAEGDAPATATTGDASPNLTDPTTGQTINAALVPPPSPEIDLKALNAHTRELVRICVSLTVLVGFWFIWYEELPTIGLLDATLWSNPEQVNRLVEDADGNEVLQTTTELRPIRVSDVLFAIIVVFVTLNVARNVPSLLEVLVLQYLPMDSGARYAAATLARYILTVIGIVVAFAMIGIGWGKVQWLVAALTVGLGFGLQELFANFVCGLILLFERPIRVGDIVTVGDTTGIATKIHIRATTIRDWDRKEYVVPNKELVTGRLLNWTLSDTINRLVIKVGVAYGSDTDRARDLLLEILSGDPEVMDDPGPVVTFEGFGDSTLDIVVRAYLPTLDNRLETVHRLHTTIHQRFNDAGLEIAFPQRDIHVRSLTVPEEIIRDREAARAGAFPGGEPKADEDEHADVA